MGIRAGRLVDSTAYPCRRIGLLHIVLPRTAVQATRAYVARTPAAPRLSAFAGVRPKATYVGSNTFLPRFSKPLFVVRLFKMTLCFIERFGLSNPC